MRRLMSLFFLIVPSLMACASPPKAYVPVDSPLRPWTPPEADAYTPEPPEPPPAPPAAAAPKPASPPAAAAAAPKPTGKQRGKQAEKRP